MTLHDQFAAKNWSRLHYLIFYFKRSRRGLENARSDVRSPEE
jgi:hypothetical protein